MYGSEWDKFLMYWCREDTWNMDLVYLRKYGDRITIFFAGERGYYINACASILKGVRSAATSG